MSVGVESQCYAVCDICGKTETDAMVLMVRFKRELRLRGWSLGEQTKCPECRAKMERERTKCQRK